MNIQTLKYLKNLQWVFLISPYILGINLCMNEIEKAEQYYNALREAKRANKPLPEAPILSPSARLIFDTIKSQGSTSTHGGEQWALDQRNKLFAMQRDGGTFHVFVPPPL